MNDENRNEEVSVAVETPTSQLDTLKARADMMGLKYHPNIGLDKLRMKVENKLEGKAVTEEPKTTKTQLLKTTIATEKKTYISHEEFLTQQSKTIRKNINRLVRVRVSCMNPNKSAWEGEIISVGSAKIGTFKKFVPFNTEDGWHIPNIIYEAMKERKYSHFVTVKGPRGEKIRKGKLVNEFNIEVLPPLTPAEIKDLAQKQAMSGSIDQ